MMLTRAFSKCPSKKPMGYLQLLAVWFSPFHSFPNTQTPRASSWGSSSSAAIMGTWQQPESPVNQSVFTC